MPSTSSIINIGPKPATIVFSVESEPSPPVVTLSSNDTWATTGISQVKVTQNDGSSKRSITVTLSASTTADTAYNGIANATSSYTINQNCRALMVKSLPKIQLKVVSYASDYFNGTVNFTLSCDGHENFAGTTFSNVIKDFNQTNNITGSLPAEINTKQQEFQIELTITITTKNGETSPYVWNVLTSDVTTLKTDIPRMGTTFEIYSTGSSSTPRSQTFNLFIPIPAGTDDYSVDLNGDTFIFEIKGGPDY